MTGSFFNSLDYFYILLVLISCLIGFFRGFVKDFFSTCSWLGSGFFSAFLSPYFAYHLQKNKMVSDPILAKIVAVVVSFTVILITLQLAVHLLSKTIKSTMFAGLDRAFGTLYGFFRGFVILIIICICVVMFNIIDLHREFVTNSKITPVLLSVVDHLMPKMVNIPINNHKPAPHTDKSTFTKETFREMERFSKEQIRKNKESLDKQTEDTGTQLKKFGGYLNEIVSEFFEKKDSKRETLKEIPLMRKSDRRSKIKNKEDNVQFGYVNLIKARAKRKAQKKAERIRQDLLKRLDKQSR